MYLMINRVFCFVGEKNGVKYLKIDKGTVKLEDSILTIWNQVFRGIKYHIKNISRRFPECEKFSEFKVNYDNDFDKIKFVSNDNLPIGKLIYFSTITVTITCVLKQGDLFYPQVFVDDALYQLLNDIL